MNKEISLARIVGHLMADGYVSRRYLRYNNQCSLLLKNFMKHFLNLFPNTHFIKGKTNSKTYFVQVQNKDIIEKLFRICDDFRSHNLLVPKIIKTKNIKK